MAIVRVLRNALGDLFYPVTHAKAVGYKNGKLEDFLDSIDIANPKFSNPNLLVNSDFKIWQKGTEFVLGKEPIYTADMWRVNPISSIDGESDITVKKVASGLYIKGSIYSHLAQFIEGEKFLNKVVSFSIKVDNKIIKFENMVISETSITKTSDNLSLMLNYYPNRVATYVSIKLLDNLEHTIEWVKLEEGKFVTPFISRLYEEELQLCQNFYLNDKFGAIVEYKYSGDLKKLLIIINYPPMRVAPTIASFRAQGDSGGMPTYSTSIEPIVVTPTSLRGVCIFDKTIDATAYGAYVTVSLDANIH